MVLLDEEGFKRFVKALRRRLPSAVELLHSRVYGILDFDGLGMRELESTLEVGSRELGGHELDLLDHVLDGHERRGPPASHLALGRCPALLNGDLDGSFAVELTDGLEPGG